MNFFLHNFFSKSLSNNELYICSQKHDIEGRGTLLILTYDIMFDISLIYYNFDINMILQIGTILITD